MLERSANPGLVLAALPVTRFYREECGVDLASCLTALLTACLWLQVTFWELCWNALQDFTVLILLVAGVVSIVLGLTVESKDDAGWIEGAAILLAVAVVVLVTAVNDYQKERQFQELSAITRDAKVGGSFPLSTLMRDTPSCAPRSGMQWGAGSCMPGGWLPPKAVRRVAMRQDACQADVVEGGRPCHAQLCARPLWQGAGGLQRLFPVPLLSD